MARLRCRQYYEKHRYKISKRIVEVYFPYTIKKNRKECIA